MPEQRTGVAQTTRECVDGLGRRNVPEPEHGAVALEQWQSLVVQLRLQRGTIDLLDGPR